jgi:hypothetical protein
MSTPTLTLFGVPKPFVGTTAIQQRNAITSWTLLGGGTSVILIGNDQGTAELANELAIKHIANVERNEYGTPLVSSIFQTAIDATNSTLLCYINADIILMSDFLDTLRSIQLRRSLMCGRRRDVDLEALIDFDRPSWESDLRTRAKTEGRLHASTGIDYFVFTRVLFGTLPPFAIGRAQWDNWMIFHARANGIPVIDVTEGVLAVHQNHRYGHIPGGMDSVWFGPEAQWNQKLAAEMLVPFTIDDATLRLSRQGLSRNTSRVHLARLPLQLIALSLRRQPLLRELVRSVARATLALGALVVSHFRRV